MKPKDNPWTKEELRARNNLKALTNKVKSDFSFKKIKTLRDYLHSIGQTDDRISNVLHYRDDELNRTINFKELKDRLEDLRIEQETAQWLSHYPPRIENNGGPDKIGISEIGVVEVSADLSLVVPPAQDLSLIEDDAPDYGLPPSEKEKAFLFWFQKKYCNRLLDGITVHKKHGQLLIAGAGLGKTFIVGALLRRLLDRNFHHGRTISPWPYFYVTKASVVEQTKRVLQTQFSIDTVREVTVTNYDQLRATLGELYVKEKKVVSDGIEYSKWTWNDMIAPCVFILDECQAAKNENSTQAQIITAIHRIKNPETYCVFVSATPFTRVSEGKYFVVNARLDTKMI